MRRTQWLVLLAAAAVVLPLAGCNKVNTDNYEKIENGMSIEEVEDILGKGEKVQGGSLSVGDIDASGHTYSWKSGDKVITVTFVNEKVVAKAAEGL